MFTKSGNESDENLWFLVLPPQRYAAFHENNFTSTFVGNVKVSVYLESRDFLCFHKNKEPFLDLKGIS